MKKLYIKFQIYDVHMHPGLAKSIFKLYDAECKQLFLPNLNMRPSLEERGGAGGGGLEKPEKPEKPVTRVTSYLAISSLAVHLKQAWWHSWARDPKYFLELSWEGVRLDFFLSIPRRR